MHMHTNNKHVTTYFYMYVYRGWRCSLCGNAEDEAVSCFFPSSSNGAVPTSRTLMRN